jgi:hypothetical protein
MNISIKEVKTRGDLRQFIHLPARIHEGHKNWVPPVYMDERVFFNPKKNTAFSYSDTLLLLAYKGNRLAGRIMGIINHKYNQEHDEKFGRFCFLETWDEPEVAHVLLDQVANWAREKGMDLIVGPLGFSDKDPQGLLVEGFDAPMVITSNCNYPYLVDFVIENGFSKKLDLVVYEVKVPDTIPVFYNRIHARAMRNNPGLQLVDLKSKRGIKPWIVPVLSLMNETFREIYAFTPLSIKEMKEFASRYFLILHPGFIKILVNENKEVVAFILGIPDLTDGIRKSRGFVLPFGIFHILRSQKRTKRLSLMLGAIRKDYRKTGVDTILGTSMLEEAKKAGFTHIDSHLEMESHHEMRAEMEKMGGKVYKRYRIFQKQLN